MIQVQLHNLLFRSFHGIHEEEKILGNEYLVDVSATIHEDAKVIHSIHETIDYESLYNIIRERMGLPTPLLETVAMEIGNEICREFPAIRSITIGIKKMHPPVEGMQGQAGITWHKDF